MERRLTGEWSWSRRKKYYMPGFDLVDPPRVRKSPSFNRAGSYPDGDWRNGFSKRIQILDVLRVCGKNLVVHNSPLIYV